MRNTEVMFTNDQLIGEPVEHKTTRIANLKGIFQDENLRSLMPPETVIYEVDIYTPVSSGTLGGLFFGITRIQPGLVGDEYFMTRGHFHALPDRAEFYWGIGGVGMLILMDRNRKVKIEKMQESSLHYIPAHTAHRVVNVGDDVLSFGACWPADAGYDYMEIENHGFSARIINLKGSPKVTPV